MNASLEQNVEILSDHYVQRFKFLLEGEMLNLQVKRHKDAYLSLIHISEPTRP